MVRGKNPNTFGARIDHDLERFVLRSQRPLAFQVDGDHLDEREEIHFRSVPHAVGVYV
jgi:diacylglycerol kinase family enzyme